MTAGGMPRSVGRVVQECSAGLVVIRQDGDQLAFAAPPTVRSGDLEPEYLARGIKAFGVRPEQVIEHQWADNGPGWADLRLASAEEVLALEPDFSTISDAMVGAIGAYPDGSDCAFELRSFAPGVGVYKDPICGSMNASVAQWLTRGGMAPLEYSVSQGSKVSRSGRITISTDGEDVLWVGGTTTVLFTGTATV